MERVTLEQIALVKVNILTKENFYGFFDWFCPDRFLEAKGKNLLSKVYRLIKTDRLDLKKTSVLFKNNLPCVGNSYDDIRFIDIETDNVIYTIVPKSGHKCDKGRAEVWGRENNFKEPLKVGTWAEVLKWFQNKGDK